MAGLPVFWIGLDREGHLGAVDVRRQEPDAEPVQLLPEDVELVGIAKIERHQRGEEFDRVVGLQIGRLIGHERVGRGMRFVEAVAGKFGHLIEDQLGAGALDPARRRPLEKQLALRLHLGRDLLAHRAAQQIGAAEAVASQHLGDLHDLLLVGHDAVGFLQDPLERRVQVIGLLLAVLDRDVSRDVLHRPRPVERVGGDDVLEPVRAQLPQHVAHAGAFDLEHPDRVAARQKLVGGGVVERQCRQIELDAAGGEQLAGPRQHGQGLETEKVEFYQPRELDPFHVELRDRDVGARVAIERHQLGQGPVADHHPRGMRRGVPVEAFELQRDRDQPGDALVGVALLLQSRLGGERLFEGDRVRRVVRNKLAQAIDLAVGHREHPADVAQYGAGLQFAEGDDLRDAVAAVFLLDVADHLVAPVLAEIDVEIRHRHALGV